MPHTVLAPALDRSATLQPGYLRPVVRHTTYDIRLLASKLSGVSKKEILSSDRTRRCVTTRAAISKVARQRGKSLPQIGAALGGRDHTTVLHYLQNLSDQPDVRALADKIEAALADYVPWHCCGVRKAAEPEPPELTCTVDEATGRRECA